MTITSTDVQMFGCTQQAMDAMMEDSLYRSMLGDTNGALMLAMGILSDAQHVMACGNTDQARQFINKSKYVIGKVMDQHDNRSDDDGEIA
jgi:hypothetical protein